MTFFRKKKRVSKLLSFGRMPIDHIGIEGTQSSRLSEVSIEWFPKKGSSPEE